MMYYEEGIENNQGYTFFGLIGIVQVKPKVGSLPFLPFSGENLFCGFFLGFFTTVTTLNKWNLPIPLFFSKIPCLNNNFVICLLVDFGSALSDMPSIDVDAVDR